MCRSDMTDADFAAALWPDIFEGITGTSTASAPQSVHEDSVTGYLSNTDTGHTNFNANNDTGFMPTPGTFTVQSTYSYPDSAVGWTMLAQGPVAPQLIGDLDWTGVSPYAASSAAEIRNPVVSSSGSTTPSRSQNGRARPVGPGQSIYHLHPTFSSFGGGSKGTPVAPEFSTNIGRRYPVGWDTNEVAWPILATSETSATAAPGKRRRDESHGDRVPAVMNSREMPPQKRVRGGKANGILETARSATRIRHKPVARTPKHRTNSEPKQPVRGAERLATSNSQGIHHQSQLGPSLQQGWAVEAADGQLIWVEGSVEDVVRGNDNTVSQQKQDEGTYFEIPKDLKTRYQALLVTTQADRARGAVREIKCRFCPDAKFKKWYKFKRHCECMEAHPFTVYFCEYCGDYFARSDSCQRHRVDRPRPCLQMKPEEADAKRRATEREHDRFMGRLEGYLTTGEEDIGKSFSETIKDMYPDSSKKRIKGSRE